MVSILITGELSMIYTMIGSRSTPVSAQKVLIEFAYKAASKGFKGRSGAARGADACLEEGVKRFIREAGSPRTLVEDLQEVYIPWQGFSGKNKNRYGILCVEDFDNREDGLALAENLHPASDKCSDAAKLLHGRNPYQILGKDLNSPSDFVVLWGVPESNQNPLVKGGTRTAMKLALDNDIPVYNTNTVEGLNRILNFFN